VLSVAKSSEAGVKLAEGEPLADGKFFFLIPFVIFVVFVVNLFLSFNNQ